MCFTPVELGLEIEGALVAGRRKSGDQAAAAGKSLTRQVGGRIRSLRREHGWNLSDVSSKIGIPVSALSKFETGKQSMSYVRLLNLAELFGVELGELFDQRPSRQARVLGRRSIDRDQSGGTLDDTLFKDVYLATDLLRKSMTPIVCTTRVGRVEDWKEWSHHVGEEFVFVLERRLIICSELYTPVTLEVGDSMYFDADVGHGYVAGDGEFSRFLSVCESPPQSAHGGFEQNGKFHERLTDDEELRP